MDKTTEEFMAQLLGIDLQAEKQRRAQEFIDYIHLLDTMTPKEFVEEAVRHFGTDIHQAAIIATIIKRGNG